MSESNEQVAILNDENDNRGTSSQSRRRPQQERSNNDDNEDEEPHKADLNDILYGMDSFYAIVQPVFITMVLAALSVIYITTPEYAQAQEAGLSKAYKAVQTDEDASNSRKLGDSLINGLIIVSVIGVMTFGIVLLYKYRCMKCLLGYMIFSSMMLLGYLSSVMLRVAIDRYEFAVDKITFYFFLYNFALVGTACIFYSKPFPTYMTQFYLIVTSVIVAWQLSYFDAWTAWVLLFLLAIYDLCAVLTPCGPLKALVNLMSRENAPDMPGLLYEANLAGGNRRRNNNNNRSNDRPTQPTATPETATDAGANPARPEASNAQQPTDRTIARNSATVSTQVTHGGIEITQEPTILLPSVQRQTRAQIQTQTQTQIPTQAQTQRSARDTTPEANSTGDVATENMPNVGTTPEQALIPRPTHFVPLAIVKLYKLPLKDDPNPSWRRESNDTNAASPEHTVLELQAEVEAEFPRVGGRILRHTRQKSDGFVRYAVLDRTGAVKHVLFVNEKGEVMEDRSEQNRRKRKNEARKERQSIRLGLGDFIFYSILVSKAALYSFTSFAACTLVILMGLGLTLLILALRGHALPALPFSIFLGVLFYLVTRYALQPFMEEIIIQQTYA